MGNCGNCDLDCFYCIEKKETKFDILAKNNNRIIPKKDAILSQVRQAEYRLVSGNKIIKNDDITSVFTIDENTFRKKFNEISETHLMGNNNSKDISQQITKRKLIIDNNEQNQNNQDNQNSNILNLDTNAKYFDEINKEAVNEEKKSESTLRYNNTNFKSANVSFLKYFEKIEDNSKNFEMTAIDKNTQRRLTNIFPIKFNYEKEKYINYFADDSL